ncbi:Peptidoglycan glycosyltransferase MrdB [invertebrate metagenome]|uniref:Peptidoglycan glycosyltransferase MrdB n=1 Tax=invertebrate metagenome TaxID=1711999 RepID=A0A2H9T6Y7_9ZZZZ
MPHSDFVRQLNDVQGVGRQSSWLLRWHIDPILALCLFLLSTAGLFVLYSATSKDMDTVVRQSVYLVIGFVAMFAVAQVSPRILMIWARWLYLASVLLLIVVLVLGIESKGAQRWIQLPGFRFQPSELAKLMMPIVVASYLARRSLPPSLKDVCIVFLMVGGPVLLIAIQPDLGTSLLIAASGLFVLLLSGLKWRWILSVAVLAVPSVYVLWHFFMYDYQKQRVLTFLNPESDPWGAGWNIIQSMIAIGSGGLYGKGWIMGTQSHLDFLPESHTDFIIAVLSEEFGFTGCIVLLAMYALILGRGIFIALHAQTLFGRLLAGSITLTFFVYVFVNIGMVSGVLPVVGVPLPLVSRGGTSIVTIMLGFGMLMSVHTERRFLGCM